MTYLRPRTLDEAITDRAAHPDWMLLAGGTDLLVSSALKPHPPGVIDLFGLEPLSRIDEQPDGALRIGAAVPYARILASAACRRELPCLVAAAREIGALQIQARGTLGGNIGTSSPVGDSLPALLALDAEIDLASPRGRRTVAYAGFCTGYRRTVLAADELICAVRFPPRPAGLRQHWRKVGTRRAQSISKVMLAAAAVVDGGAITHVRVALGAVADRPIRAAAVEAALAGGRPGPDLADAARTALAGEIKPIDDVRSAADYRLHVAQNLVARFVTSLA
ncbi:MAG TPA: xanthine dehydrogenase family protein subunit M [Kofleriaceae bacterium]|nr:xanthine dehydrogenase family protein subunit M [Kofleriaceae bacterium]